MSKMTKDLPADVPYKLRARRALERSKAHREAGSRWGIHSARGFHFKEMTGNEF